MKNKLKAIFFKLRFNLSASNNFLFMMYYKYFYKPKDGSIELLLSDFSKKIGTSFNVIQIGANDGITHDPIHKFIKRDKWNGVLLEPQRYVYEEFLSKIYKKHSNIHTLNAALGEKDGKAKIYKIGFTNARWATGLTTFDKATLEKAFTNGHVQRKCSKEGTQIPEDKSLHIIEEEVEIISAASIISRYHFEHIHLLMIDTEGFDYEVIKMFNISKNKPDLVIYEKSHLSEEDQVACIQLLKDNGYKVFSQDANTVALQASIEGFETFFN
ncbi:FkbM family methyltransferase [Paracrocinitomix mangrovi]|uniref:FkbM family methyltransferase n=1 Tax=Paracrocinitomix mangrovi TaxID=2862509 RepID=UPI001C8DB180|nr:FkbM family methyltransferase [Paracrocinitomix mangrovi]UKN03090.1 FkbM family methyltransferase [Paracrocinitomix mangrovi]